MPDLSSLTPPSGSGEGDQSTQNVTQAETQNKPTNHTREVQIPLEPPGESASQPVAEVQTPVPPSAPPTSDDPNPVNVSTNMMSLPTQTQAQPPPPPTMPRDPVPGSQQGNYPSQGNTEPDYFIYCLSCFCNCCYGDTPSGLLIIAVVCVLVALFINLFAVCTVNWFHQTMTPKRRNTALIGIIVGSIINTIIIVVSIL